MESTAVEKTNGVLGNTCEKDTPRDQIENDNTNQLLRVLVDKMSWMEDFLIEMRVKLNNTNGTRQFNGNARTEINISDLNKMDLPVETAQGIEQLEVKLKDEDFKQKLVRNIKFSFYSVIIFVGN